MQTKPWLLLTVNNVEKRLDVKLHTSTPSYPIIIIEDMLKHIVLLSAENCHK